MSRLANLLAELKGLFIDDERFAQAIAGGMAVVYVLFVWHVLPAPVAGIALFAAFAGILIESVARATRA